MSGDDLSALLHDHAGARLVERASLEDPGAASVLCGDGLRQLDVIVVRNGGHIRAYLNACPHAGTPLDAFPGRLLDRADSSQMICATHGARFRIEDGLCVKGPCIGKTLPPLAVEIVDGWVVLARKPAGQCRTPSALGGNTDYPR